MRRAITCRVCWAGVRQGQLPTSADPSQDNRVSSPPWFSRKTPTCLLFFGKNLPFLFSELVGGVVLGWDTRGSVMGDHCQPPGFTSPPSGAPKPSQKTPCLLWQSLAHLNQAKSFIFLTSRDFLPAFTGGKWIGCE